MTQLRTILGIVVGVILIASGVSRFNPFFFVFIVPGLTLVATSWWPTTVAGRLRE